MKIWPGIKILDRYIIRKFIGTYLFAIAMIIVVVVLFDYVEKLDDFTEMKAPVQAIIFDYYLNFVPFFINQFSGLFTFIACIFFTSKMAYQTEIVAMLSGGMSFRRLMWPYFVSALLIASLSLTLNLWVIPVSQRAQVVNFEIAVHQAQAEQQRSTGISTGRSSRARSPTSAVTTTHRSRRRSSRWRSITAAR